jgi:hypothetical protein
MSADPHVETTGGPATTCALYPALCEWCARGTTYCPFVGKTPAAIAEMTCDER